MRHDLETLNISDNFEEFLTTLTIYDNFEEFLTTLTIYDNVEIFDSYHICFQKLKHVWPPKKLVP